ncbi:hypothetical protein SAMN04487830_11865 [Pseudobutyrivibrio sp. OR37]|uniref:hypothetical protein n=1 Tax=Pseudobutyrivibrio sp. OR37 TaxID=1798186 RepID=UPI0008F2F817|nr:hypothetical protein [Pseudobutyrivibrio sp. OR37]SFI03089.1 hypothetical protein SAMN04487830_11865 [Pseudobutyrivibrio sp. OR37]
MDDLFDKNINIDTYKPESKGVRIYKAFAMFRFIFIIYALSFEFLAYFWLLKKNIFQKYLEPQAYLLVGFSVLFFCLIVYVIIDNLAFRKKLLESSPEVNFDYYFYTYKKSGKKNQNNTITAIACALAEMGDKLGCQKVLSLLPVEYKPRILSELRDWLKSEETSFDNPLLHSTKRSILRAIVFPIMSLLIAAGLLASCIDYTILIGYGFNKTCIMYFGVLQCAAWLYLTFICIILIIYYFNRNRMFLLIDGSKEYSKSMTLVALLILLLYISVNPAVSYVLTPDELNTTSDNISSSYEIKDEEELWSEHPDDTEVMLKMIILCDWLQKRGVIGDFHVLIEHDENDIAMATVSKDDNYAYVLHENGFKDDINGCKCLEFILKAEPLDAKGKSLGPEKEKLIGYYLVKYETDEVFEEFKAY